MKKDSYSLKQSEAQSKRRKSGVVVERKPQDVMAELVARLADPLDVTIVPAVEETKGDRDRLRPNLDRLTVGVDLGDQWSNYCILGLGGETLAEGQFRTRKQETAEFFQGLATSRVVVEVGTHSAWVREIIAGFGHEVLVANPRLMEGSKRRRRKNDRIDAEKLADRKSTRLNSSHLGISYAVFCLKKKKNFCLKLSYCCYLFLFCCFVLVTCIW